MLGILILAVAGIVFLVWVITKLGTPETHKETATRIIEAGTVPFEPTSVDTTKTAPILPSMFGVAAPESEYPGPDVYTQLVDPRTQLTPYGEQTKEDIDQAMKDYAAGRITLEEYNAKVTALGFPPG